MLHITTKVLTLLNCQRAHSLLRNLVFLADAKPALFRAVSELICFLLCIGLKLFAVRLELLRWAASSGLSATILALSVSASCCFCLARCRENL
jgi:hypothetical protein